MEKKMITIIVLTIVVIFLIFQSHTATFDLTHLNHSYNYQVERNAHLSNFYYNITEQQTQNIEELIEENQLLRHHIYYQEWNITNLSNQLLLYDQDYFHCKASLDYILNSDLIKTKTKYEDVIKFARNDNTKYNTYDAHTYDCKSFTEDYIKNSISEGLYACFARIYYTNGDWHAVAQYNTNKGKVYIEPQSGYEIKLKKGMNMCGHTVDYWTDCIGGEI